MNINKRLNRNFLPQYWLKYKYYEYLTAKYMWESLHI